MTLKARNHHSSPCHQHNHNGTLVLDPTATTSTTTTTSTSSEQPQSQNQRRRRRNHNKNRWLYHDKPLSCVQEWEFVLCFLVGTVLVLVLAVLVVFVLSIVSPTMTTTSTTFRLRRFSNLISNNGHHLVVDTNSKNNNQKKTRQELEAELQALEERIRYNQHSGTTWVNTHLLPPFSTANQKLQKEQALGKSVAPSTSRTMPLMLQQQPTFQRKEAPKQIYNQHGVYFHVSRLAATLFSSNHKGMAWEEEWNMLQAQKANQPKRRMDYTNPNLYIYPQRNMSSKDFPLQPLSKLLQDWPQDDLDSPRDNIQEGLQHFDYNTELDLAQEYMETVKLPFKLTNVPDILEANQKWTDQYLSLALDNDGIDNLDDAPSKQRADYHAKCQESPTNFFTFFLPNAWNVENLGLPPTRTNDMMFETWSKHAKYADSVGLSADQPHYYYQASVTSEDLLLNNGGASSSSSFLARDLPIFATPSPMFVNMEQQKGIQCRFGERGITTAAHFDGGKNMIAMITGAKRYILLPPKQCPNLGILTTRGHSLYRHSVLNLGHMDDLHDRNMPREEHDWLERAGTAMAVETVLKEGEILYIPSHWFHYIISLQKSAQCNIRSGVDVEGTLEYGGQAHVQPEFCG